MSGGGTMKSTSETQDNPEAMATSKLLREDVLRPLITSVMPQWLQSLQGGGAPSSQTPGVQQQVSAINSGTSTAKTNLQQMLARMGLSNTPWAARALGEVEQQGAVAANSVGPQMSMKLFESAIPAITGGVNIQPGNSGNTSGTSKTNDGGAQAGQLAGSLAAAMAAMYSAYAMSSAATASSAGSGAAAGGAAWF